MSEILRLHCLGGLQITQGDQPVTGFISGKAQALLCYLALADGPRLRTELATLFWSEMVESVASKNLRMALSNLKQLLAPHIEITRQTAAFNRIVPYWLDVEEFQHRVNHALRRESAQMLEEVVNLYKGDFLTGFLLKDAAPFEEWMLGQRERWRTLAIQALHHLAAHHTRRGEYTAGIDFTSRLLLLEPWREEAHQQMMVLLSRSGQRSAALAQFEKCKHILKEELDVEPMNSTQTLYEQIKAAGHHPRHNLPMPSTSWVGRTEELAELSQRLEQEDCRLLTLVGAGGIGKTRLALELANRTLHRFLHGVYFISLAALSSAELIPIAIGQALGLTFSGRQTPKDQLILYLSDKEILLILDNFEHLMEATSLIVEILEKSPELKILTTSRQRLDLTWEWVFEVPGLQVPPVEGNGHTLAESFSAVDLFLKRAHQAKGIPLPHSDLPRIIQVCQWLEGMPLGIELAAAWTRTRSCQEAADVLQSRLIDLSTTAQDVPWRHRSLQAAFDHSWALLSTEEKELFKKLSVFRGGFTREAIIEVCLGAPITSTADPLLQSLIHKSLVRSSTSDQNRFYLLEPVRQYATEKLKNPQEKAALSRKHLGYFLRLAQQAERKLRGQNQKLWFEKLRDEQSNVRAALQWALEEEVERALELSASLSVYWELQAQIVEAMNWLEQALTACSKKPDVALAKALAWIGRFAELHGDYQRAASYLEQALSGCHKQQDQPNEALALNNLALVQYHQGAYESAHKLYQKSLCLYRHLRDIHGIAMALNNLGVLAEDRGEYDAARSYYEQALALHQQSGDRWNVSKCLHNLAIVAEDQGDYARAQSLCEQSLALIDEPGLQRRSAFPLISLGNLAMAQGNYAKARELYEEALLIMKKMDDRWSIALILDNLGQEALIQNELAQGRRLCEESLGLFREMGEKWGIAQSLCHMGTIALRGGQYDAARTYYRESLELRKQIGNKKGLAETIAGIGGLAYKTGQFQRAAKLLGGVDALLASTGASLSPVDRVTLEETVLNLSSVLGKDDFTKHWEAGHGLSLDEIATNVLDDSAF